MIDTIVVGGQAGVDQGAASAAVHVGLRVAGFRPAVTTEQTEDGDMPGWLAGRLKPLEFGGYTKRTLANVDGSDLLLVIVPNRLRPEASPGTALTLDLAEQRLRYPVLVTDGSPADKAFVVEWLSRALLRCRPTAHRLMVAGPRASKWPDGYQVARDFVVALFERQLSFGF